MNGRSAYPLSPSWAVGRYYFCPNSPSTSTNNTLGNGTLRAVPFYIPNAVSITKIGSEISTIGEAGSKLRLGLYTDSGYGRPDALVFDAGQIAGDSATVQELTLGSAVRVGPGWYWAAGVVQSAPTSQPTVRTVGFTGIYPVDSLSSTPSANHVNFGFAQTSVTGALPATFSVSSISGQTPPRIFVKL